MRMRWEFNSIRSGICHLHVLIEVYPWHKYQLLLSACDDSSTHSAFEMSSVIGPLNDNISRKKKRNSKIEWKKNLILLILPFVPEDSPYPIPLEAPLTFRHRHINTHPYTHTYTHTEHILSSLKRCKCWLIGWLCWCHCHAWLSEDRDSRGPAVCLFVLCRCLLGFIAVSMLIRRSDQMNQLLYDQTPPLTLNMCIRHESSCRHICKTALSSLFKARATFWYYLK